MRKIDKTNYQEISPFIKARKELLQFGDAQAWRIKGRYFFEGRDKACLIYKKNNMYGKDIFFLCRAPMTMDLDYEREKYLLEGVLRRGVPAVITSEDVKNYGQEFLDRYNYIIKQKEYVYNSADVPRDLAGKDWKKWRYAKNEMQVHGQPEFYESGKIPFQYLSALQRIAEKWKDSMDHVGGFSTWFLETLSFAENTYVMLTKSNTGKELLGYSLFQVYGNTIIYADEKYDKEFLSKLSIPITKVLHYWAYGFFKDLFKEDRLFNTGISGTPGLTINKELLTPSMMLEIYRLTSKEM